MTDPSSSRPGDDTEPGFWDRLIGRSTPAPAPGDINDEAAIRATLGRLDAIPVGDVAVPKADIVALPADADLDATVQAFREATFSRLPVYEDTLDAPVGLIHLKDLALAYGFGPSDEAFELKGLIRDLLYVPPSMPIGALLQKMQAQRLHMALIIDEYGGVDGLVTIEDLIEQVVGEIEDEHDETEAALWVEERSGVWLARARAPLTEFEEETGLRLAIEDEEEVDTLGGLVFMLAGRVPARGEVVAHPEGYEVEVIDADARRIKRLRVRAKPLPRLERAAE